MTGQAVTVSTGYGVRCIPCGVAGDPVDQRGDADQLAAVHNTLHHQGQPVAVVEPVHGRAGAAGATERGFLEPPGSDAELLMYCVLISDVLRAFATQVSDWAVSLGSAGLPAPVTDLLAAAADIIHDHARAALHAGAALEHDLAHARTIAARGLVFTGHDAS